MFTTKPLSQRDPQWKQQILGTDPSATIGSDGCLITCLTMYVNGCGASETPASLNAKLINLGPGRGYSGALLVWSGVQRVFPNVELRTLRITRSVPANVSEIDVALSLGDCVIVEVDHSPQPGFDNHWVLIYEKSGGDYLIHDPWPVPAELADAGLLKRYGFAGDASKVITAAAFFHSLSGQEPAGDPVSVIVVNDQEVVAAGGLALRSEPNGASLTRMPAGTTLTALEPASSVRAKIGGQLQWLHVRLADGTLGYAAAWFLQLTTNTPVDNGIWLRVLSDPDIVAAGGLALRDQPAGALITRLPAGSRIKAQGTQAEVITTVGNAGQWQRVQVADGTIGYVAAWLVSREPTNRDLPASRQSANPAEQIQLPIRNQHSRLAGKIISAAQRAPPASKHQTSRSTALIKMRSSPRTGAVVGKLKPGSRVWVLESHESAISKAGHRGQWIHVQHGGGPTGYISAQSIKLTARYHKTKQSPDRRARTARGATVASTFVEPDIRPFVRVQSTSDIVQAGGLSLRTAPSVGSLRIARLAAGTLLLSRLSGADTAATVGLADRWLPVALLNGQSGFCAAWYLELVGAPVTPPSPSTPSMVDPAIVSQRAIIAVEDARIRAAGTQDAPTTWQVTAGTPLRVTEDGADWLSKVSMSNEWIAVETYAFKSGFVRGSQVRLPAMPDKRTKVEDAPLPFGISAWLYGIHDPFDRGLFAPYKKGGWVLFTERVQSQAGNSSYADWSDDGYGVIGRLNNDYGGTGTIPTTDQYGVFAANCAQWVGNSRGCLIWVIGNEQNNPREWPGWHDGLDACSHAMQITPEQYADCFNRVRSAIKQVNPKAMVVPGALDCFQGPCMSSMEYFNRMLAKIDDLDGFALHCYTNGYTPDLVTSLGTFGNDPLTWQYYNFRAFTTYLDQIPEKWRGKPVFVTETDAHGADPWHGDGNGWVPAAYGEIDRWNNQPHSQQIRSAILYRWSTDDAYTIQRRSGVQNDIRTTIGVTDYRWRA